MKEIAYWNSILFLLLYARLKKGAVALSKFIQPKRLFAVILAALITAVNLNSFVHTGGLFPGGATGLTVLAQRIFHNYLHIEISYSLVNIILNSIPIYIGFRYIGKKFTLYSLLMILLTGVFVDIIPTFTITYDPVLISIFGGIINGAIMSLCLSVDATTGGTDFIAIFLSQKRGVDSFDLILYFNGVVLLIAGLLFGWDKALYSILYQYVSTQTLHLLFRNYQQQTLFIVTEKPREVCEKIYEISRHGATYWKAKALMEETINI